MQVVISWLLMWTVKNREQSTDISLVKCVFHYTDWHFSSHRAECPSFSIRKECQLLLFIILKILFAFFGNHFQLPTCSVTGITVGRKHIIVASQKKCFSTILGIFWKIEFLKEYQQVRTLQKWWKFVLSQFVLRKYFLAKLFVPLIKGSASPQFYTIFGKLNFWRNIDRRGPYKVVKIWTILICAKNFFLAKLFVLLIKGRVSQQF